MKMYTTNPKSVDLERDYMPSFHSTRFQDEPQPDVAVVDHFIRLTKQHTVELTTKHGISIRSDVRYGGNDDRQLADIYYHGEEKKGTPLFVFIHGGYWQMLDKSSGGSIVAPLVARGYRVMVMDYNLCPQVTLTQLVQQFRDFLRWVFEYASETETTEISFAGHSAGAHLLTIILNCPEVVTPEKVQLIKGIFLISGVYDLRECWSLKLVNPDDILSVNASNAADLSSVCWQYTDLDDFKKQRTPVHVLVAEHDSETFIGHSHALAELFKKLGLNAHYKIFDGYDHMDIFEETANEQSEITKYMRLVLGK